MKTNISHRCSDLYADGSNAIFLIRWIFRLAYPPALAWSRQFSLSKIHEHDRGLLREKRRLYRFFRDWSRWEKMKKKKFGLLVYQSAICKLAGVVQKTVGLIVRRLASLPSRGHSLVFQLLLISPVSLLPLPPASASCLCLPPLPPASCLINTVKLTFSDALLLLLQISASRRTTPTRGGKKLNKSWHQIDWWFRVITFKFH